jgi:hypothetical protein
MQNAHKRARSDIEVLIEQALSERKRVRRPHTPMKLDMV